MHLTVVNSPEDQMLLKGITSDRCLSATSKKAYAMRLRLLASKRRKPILDIILEADQSLAWLCQTYSEVCTRGSLVLSWQQSGDALQGLPYGCRKHNNSGYKSCCCLTVFCNKGIRAICQLQGKLQAMYHGQTFVKLRDKLERGSKARLLLCLSSDNRLSLGWYFA
ncbi:hypothetical protein ABBQ32_008555 [Trebouxia sp. C0010 RCD-2024]